MINRKRKRNSTKTTTNKKTKITLDVEKGKRYLYDELLSKNNIEENRLPLYRKGLFKKLLTTEDKTFKCKLLKEYLGYIVSKTLERVEFLTVEELEKTISQSEDHFLILI